MSDNNDDDEGEKKITLEDFYQGMTEGITETKQILYNTGQKFQAIADVEKEKPSEEQEK